MNWLTEVMTGVPALVVYAIMAVLVCSETALLAGVAVPTLSTLLLVGFMCRAGSLDLTVALGIAVLAGVLGDHLGYWTGRRQGTRLRATRLGRRIGDNRWNRADEMIRQRGGRAALAGRFITVVRTLVPHLCGVAGMRYRSFTMWNLPGVAGWASLEILAGYAAGSSYERLSTSFGRATAALAVLGVVGVFVVLGGRWLGRHPDPARAGWRLLSRSAAAATMIREPRALPNEARGWFGPRRLTAFTLGVGLVLLFAAGWVLTKVTGLAVRFSGLSSADGPILAWLAERQDLRTAALVIAVGVTAATGLFVTAASIVSVIVTLRRLRQRPTLLDALAALGPVIPLLALNQIVTSAQTPAGPPDFYSFTAVNTAAVVLLAWSMTRRPGWLRAAIVWAVSAGGILVISGSRIYVGWGWPSDTVTSVILGAFWATATIVVVRIRRKQVASGSVNAV
jgi:undecaprenyl-diphosphatase